MNKREVFKYGIAGWLIPLLAWPMVCLITAGAIWSMDQYRPGDWMIYAWFLPTCALLFLWTPLAYRDVVVGVEGIGRAFPWTRARLVPWDEVTAVNCFLLSKADGKAKFYHLKTGNGGYFSGVKIMTTISDVERLIALIDVEIHCRGIPIRTRNADGWVTLDRLPQPITGPAAWK
jgi:hypothetical protein